MRLPRQIFQTHAVDHRLGPTLAVDDHEIGVLLLG
jgi:hypothetical protein